MKDTGWCRCAQNRIVYTIREKRLKYSAKGVQKANFNRAHDTEKSKQQTFGETIISMYSNALATDNDGSAPPDQQTTEGCEPRIETEV